MAIVVDLQDLIATVEKHAADDPLARLAFASSASEELTGTADQLVWHFVRAARDAGASWAEIGNALGVSKQGAQQRFDLARRLRELIRRDPGRPAMEIPMLQRFTPRARRSITAAAHEATRLHHEHVGTEHLLLGLLSEPEGVAVQVLDALGHPSEAVRDAVAASVQAGAEPVVGHGSFTPGARHARDLTMREAVSLGHNYIGTEHILLGLMREEQGLAATTLRSLGLTQELLGEKVVELLGALGEPA